MTKNKPLKYIGYAIVFQEVPNEITLAFNISDCPYKCRGCHSEYLWEYKGDFLLKDIENIIFKYRDFITCICFLGGDQNLNELEQALSIVKKYKLKTCVYSGNDNISLFKNLYQLLDYIKIGHYDESKGGLNNKYTNQKMYKIEDGKVTKDITPLFWQNNDMSDIEHTHTETDKSTNTFP